MDQGSHSFCVISDSLPKEHKKVEAYKKDLNFQEIYNLYNSGKIDTVFVRRSDSSEDEVFVLSKANDMMTLMDVISNDGDHLLGWKVKLLNKANEDLAAAMEVEEVKNLKGTYKGSFVDGFTLPESETTAKGTAKIWPHNEVKKESKETANKGQYIVIAVDNNDDDSDTIEIWKPKAMNLKKQVKTVAPKNGLAYCVSYS